MVDSSVYRRPVARRRARRRPTARAGRLSGEPRPVAEGVGMNVTSNYFGSFAASAGGVLAYGQGPRGRISQLSWFDVSANGGTGIWTIDLERSLNSRFTFDAKVSINNSPAWSPDGSRVAFHQGNALAFGSCL